MTLGSERGTVALAALSSAAFALPLFLIGALAVQIRQGFAFDAAALGLLIGMSRGAGIVWSVPLGWVADRLGATRALRAAPLISLIAGVGVALSAHSWLTLALWMIFASMANSLGLPGANRLLIRTVRPERRGLAFGIKQSAPPTATMLAGISVPVVALTIGWRWAFVLVAILALAMVLVLTVRARSLNPISREAAERRRLERRAQVTDPVTLIILASGIGLGMAAATSLAAFFVDYAVSHGAAEDLAGYALAAASLMTICARLWAGAKADRMKESHLRLCAAMLIVGSAGYAVLAMSNLVAVSLVGLLVALASGWGFNGVFWDALTRANPERPGSVTGMVRPGALLGGSLGPLLMGLIVGDLGRHVPSGCGGDGGWRLAAQEACHRYIGKGFGRGGVGTSRPP